MERTITVTGTATVTAPADITTVTSSVQGVAKTFKEAAQALADSTSALKDAIEDAGIPRDSLKTSDLAIEQHFREEKIGEDRHGNDKFRNVPDGFSYRQNIIYEFPNDNEKLSKSISNIMKCSIEPVISFSYRNSDPESMKIEALSKAASNARAEAEAILKAAGSRLGMLLEVGRNPDPPMYKARNAMSFCEDCECVAIDVDPTDATMTQTVTLKWSIEGA
jgi:hypothetical protein